MLSHDGKTLAYVTRVDSSHSIIKLRDVATGQTRAIGTAPQADMQQAPFSTAIPGYAFTPDDRALLMSGDNRLWRIDIGTGARTQIPFTADVEQALAQLTRFESPVSDSLLRVRQIRDAVPSPDGTRLVFSALDRLWMMDLPAGVPYRLTQEDIGKFSPAWSPDGHSIAYATWSDSGGHIQRVASTGGRPERLTRAAAWFDRVRYTPDGQHLNAMRGSREQMRERYNKALGLSAAVVLVAISTSDGTTVPSPAKTNAGVTYSYEKADGVASVIMAQGPRHALFRVMWSEPYLSRRLYADEVAIAPDGRHAIARLLTSTYYFEVPARSGDSIPVVKLRRNMATTSSARVVDAVGGEFLSWSRAGDAFFYSLGASFFRVTVGDAGRTLSAPVRTDVNLVVRKDTPSGSMLLRNGRIITMRGAEIIEHGDIPVKNNRIAAVGASGTLRVPTNATVFDVTGKTIIPGWIDTHAHVSAIVERIHPPQAWEFATNLAYGITTMRDPQINTDALSYGDVLDVGGMIGSRFLTTGPGVFPYEDINSLADARLVMRRYAHFYHTETVKQYLNGASRISKQWYVMATREARLTPVAHTLSGDYKTKLALMLDGYSGMDHAIEEFPLGDDFIQLAVASGIAYTPTYQYIVEAAGMAAYDSLADHSRKWLPPFDIPARIRNGLDFVQHPVQVLNELAPSAARLVAAGAKVTVASHGQLQGLGFDLELWDTAFGQHLPVFDVLRAGTIRGAEAIGHLGDLGSIERGKLADLQILDANPLEHITNALRIRWVMKNGRLYDVKTLSEVAPTARALPFLPWWWR